MSSGRYSGGGLRQRARVGTQVEAFVSSGVLSQILANARMCIPYLFEMMVCVRWDNHALLNARGFSLTLSCPKEKPHQPKYPLQVSDAADSRNSLPAIDCTTPLITPPCCFAVIRIDLTRLD